MRDALHFLSGFLSWLSVFVVGVVLVSWNRFLNVVTFYREAIRPNIVPLYHTLQSRSDISSHQAPTSVCKVVRHSLIPQQSKDCLRLDETMLVKQLLPEICHFIHTYREGHQHAAELRASASAVLFSLSCNNFNAVFSRISTRYFSFFFYLCGFFFRLGSSRLTLSVIQSSELQLVHQLFLIFSKNAYDCQLEQHLKERIIFLGLYKSFIVIVQNISSRQPGNCQNFNLCIYFCFFLLFFVFWVND